MQCLVMAVWEAGWKKKWELWEERDDAIKGMWQQANLCEDS